MEGRDLCDHWPSLFQRGGEALGVLAGHMILPDVSLLTEQEKEVPLGIGDIARVSG